MSNLYLKNLRGKNYNLTVACCVETLQSGSFTWETVGIHQMRLVSLMRRGIIDRVPGYRDPYVYVATAKTIAWYHKHIDEGDPVAV